MNKKHFQYTQWSNTHNNELKWLLFHYQFTTLNSHTQNNSFQTIMCGLRGMCYVLWILKHVQWGFHCWVNFLWWFVPPNQLRVRVAFVLLLQNGFIWNSKYIAKNGEAKKKKIFNITWKIFANKIVFLPSIDKGIFDAPLYGIWLNTWSMDPKKMANSKHWNRKNNKKTLKDKHK